MTFNFFPTHLLKEDGRGKCRGKVHPGTSYEGPEGGVDYNTTFSLTSAQDVVGAHRHAPTALPPGKSR
jgi:hypothetical protein